MQQYFYHPQTKENKKILLKNARIIDPASNYDQLGNMLINDGKIIDFGTDIEASNAQIIDCQGHILCPGLLDIQVHFRTPGQEHKETISSGTKSAAAGGVTSVVAMANTSPPIDNIQTLEQLQDIVKRDAYVNVYQYAAITKGLKSDELTNMQALKESGAVGFSNDGLPVMNSLTMRRAMEEAARLNIVIAQHAEDLNLSDGGAINEGEISIKLKVKGVPNASEAIIVARDLLLLELTKCHYHVLHISTHQAIDFVRRAKKAGLNVTAEAAPHHFVLTDHAVLESDTLAKMNPPLRNELDKQAIIAGLIDGTIDVIATDHAPHDENSKNCHLSSAAFGIVGLETMLPLSLELYHKNLMSLSDILAKMTYKAADIMKIPKGRIAKNMDADLTLFDPNFEWQIDPRQFSSLSKNSPFANYQVKGRVLKSFVGGKLVYQLK